MWLFVVFIVVPIVEIALFIKIGALAGLWPTIMIIILTAIIGTRLVKSQGLTAIKNVQNSIVVGQDITISLIDGALVLIAGVLLLTPGFFTDCIGFAIFLKPVQNYISSKAKEYFQSRRRY